MEKLFEKKVDLRNKAKMIDFLENHFRYSTMNGWNGSSSYANCIKIYSLALPHDLEMKAYDFISNENFLDDFQQDIHEISLKLFEITGYVIGVNGRSGGYLVMYDAERIDGRIHVNCGRSIDFSDDYDAFYALKEDVKTVVAFDKACDEIREIFIDYLTAFDLKDEEYTETKTRKVLQAIA